MCAKRFSENASTHWLKEPWRAGRRPPQALSLPKSTVANAGLVIPGARKKPGRKEAGKHYLNGAPQAKKKFDHVGSVSRGTWLETRGNDVNPAKKKKRGSTP